jgi:hypothetical protein
MAAGGLTQVALQGVTDTLDQPVLEYLDFALV